MFNLGNFLRDILGGGDQPPQRKAPQGVAARPRTGQTMRTQDPKFQGYAPEITFNPDRSKNIPYSSHSMADARLGNEYTKDPTNPKFLGVDPARFGYPEDVGQYGGVRAPLPTMSRPMDEGDDSRFFNYRFPRY